MRQVLVTGAGGFIGGHIVQKCVSESCFVQALAHKKIPPWLEDLAQSGAVKLYRADIRNYEELAVIFQQLPRLDAIIHCAAKASDTGRERDFKAVNYEAVRHLVKLAKINDTENFTFISTTDVYGLRNFSGQTENELTFEANPGNPYPKYKILAEKWIQAELPEDRYSIIRPAAVWGDDDPTLTARVKAFLKWSPVIVHFGSWKGRNRWPLAEVGSVALAAYLAAFQNQAKGRAIQVLDEKHTSIDEFYRDVAARYFPQRKYRSICLPMWCGIIIGAVSTALSNLLNTAKPVYDPTLYALYSVSRNLDFSSASFEELKSIPDAPFK
jgi:nucleoside-diphosphate-sugar epimerase